MIDDGIRVGDTCAINFCGVPLKPNDTIITLIRFSEVLGDMMFYDLAEYDVIMLPGGINDTLNTWHSVKFYNRGLRPLQIVVLDHEITSFVYRVIELRL